MEFIYSTRFAKQLNKQTLKIKKQVKIKIEIFIEDEFNPLLNNHKLHGDYKEFRSINSTGDIRIVYKKVEKKVYLFSAIVSHSELCT